MQRSFEKAFIGIPKKMNITDNNIYDTIDNIKINDLIRKNIKVPVVFYLNGSAGFTKGKIYRQWIIEDTNCLFFSPNTLEIKNRPFYNNKSKIDEYEEVHLIRQKEIIYNINKLLDYEFIDKNKIFLMGNSEGALAAGIYSGQEFFSRILLAWSCESGYYKKTVDIGAKIDDPILTIIGYDDEYFSVNSEFNNKLNLSGNCIKKLSKYKNVKNVILSNTKHNLLNNPYTKEEIITFLKKWS